jgi:hypothetical protein
MIRTTRGRLVVALITINRLVDPFWDDQKTLIHSSYTVLFESLKVTDIG